MKVVLAHGVFDLLHPGHVEHLRQAREFGDALVVSVVPDKFVKKQRLVYTEAQRLGMVQALRWVSIALLCNAPGPEDLILGVRPSVYVRGSEYVDRSKPEYVLLESLGIPVAFTKPIPLHTSELIEQIKTL